MRLFKGKFHHWVLFLVIQPYSFATPGNRYRLLTVDDNGEMLMDETFDLSGRKIHQPQPHQPYIRGGKKYVGR